MYNTNLVTIKTLENGQLAIKSPYNGNFVKDLKTLVPSADWKGQRWIINASGRDQAEALLEQYYPPEDQLQTVRIEWLLERDNPQIDNVNLASISRDYWSWKRNCPIDFKVIEQSIDSGGSRNNPGLYGKLVIEAAIRPDAKITPLPTSIKIIEEGETPNPLADFSTEALVAELTRRGYEVAK